MNRTPSSGRTEWLLERATGIYLLIAIPWLLMSFPGTCKITAADIRIWLKNASTSGVLSLTLILVAVHAVLGLKSIMTDYIDPPQRRMLILFAGVFVLFSALSGLISVLCLSFGILP